MDIVERLRSFGDWIEKPSTHSFTYPDGIIHEAADEIYRLRVANGRLASYNKELLYDNKQKYAEIQRMQKIIDIMMKGMAE